jgi:hypothetical protein
MLLKSRWSGANCDQEAFPELLILTRIGGVHESTGKEHLEELCNKANEEKLQQTAETPFMT